MRFSILFVLTAGFYALSTAAVALRQNSDCTMSVTPSPVTKSAYTNVDVFYTTSVVTVYARDSSTTASPAPSYMPNLKKRDAELAPAIEERQDGPPGSQDCSHTTTMPIPTTTMTKTYTYSHAARATVTSPACGQHNIYNGTVTYNSKQAHFPVGQPRGEYFAQHTSPEACCNQCFDGSCVWYVFDNVDRDGSSWVDGCKVYWSDGACPNGNGQTEALRMENRDGERGLTGFGPCLVEVGYFMVG